MYTRRTLMCAQCKKEWRDVGTECESAVNLKHVFNEVTVECEKATRGIIFVCRDCGQKWPKSKPMPKDILQCLAEVDLIQK